MALKVFSFSHLAPLLAGGLYRAMILACQISRPIGAFERALPKLLAPKAQHAILFVCLAVYKGFLGLFG